MLSAWLKGKIPFMMSAMSLEDWSACDHPHLVYCLPSFYICGEDVGLAGSSWRLASGSGWEELSAGPAPQLPRTMEASRNSIATPRQAETLWLLP